MFRIPRPTEPGVYDVKILEGEEIIGISYSNIGVDAFNIWTNEGHVFVISVTETGKLAAMVVDLSDTAGKLPH